MMSRWSVPLLVALTVASAGVQRVRAQDLALAKPRFIATWVARGEPNDARGFSLLQRRVSLDFTGVSLSEALREVAHQARLDLSYDKSLLPAGKRVSLHAQELTVVAALTEILILSGLDVAVGRGGQLALVRKPEAAAVDSGSIAGRVTDKGTGAPIVGVTIVLDDTSLIATSSEDGGYRLANVQTGTYTVRARYIGYAPASVSVTVSADQEATADFALEKSAQRLAEVVTTGTVVPTEVRALPTPVSLIEADEFERQQPRTVQEIFRQVVPTAVSWDQVSYPTLTSFSVRGASTLTEGFGQMKVFVDGVEATSLTNAAVDPRSIERVEVIRGPQAATIYGSDASGGVIQVFTKRGEPGSTRPVVEAQALFGLMQTPYEGFGGVLRQSYAGSVRGGTSDLGYSFGGGYTHTDDYLPAGELSRTATPSVYGGVNISRGPLKVDIAGRYYVNKNPDVFNPALSETGFVFPGGPQFQNSSLANQTVGGRLAFAATSWWRHNLTLGIDRLTSESYKQRPTLRDPSDTLLSVLSGNSGKTSIGYNTSIQGPVSDQFEGVLSVGFDHYRLPITQFFAANTLRTVGNLDTDPPGLTFASRLVTNNTGYFAQAQVGYRNALFLTAGLRAEENTGFGDSLGTPVSPRVGLSFARDFGPHTLKLRGSWGRAIRATDPTNKLGFVSSSQIVLANNQLGPERQQGWDGGFDATLAGRLLVSVTYYNQIASDLIQYVPVDPDAPVPVNQFQNVGRVKNSGVEIETAFSLGPLQLRGQYGYARSRVDKLSPNYTGDLRVGDQTLLTPKHTGGGSIGGTVLGSTTLSLGVSYVGSWNYYDFDREFRCFGGTGPCEATTRDYIVSYPDFAKIDLAVSQAITPSLALSLVVDNLTNNEAFEKWNLSPTTGRITSIGLRARY